jgi:ATP-dependent exoDNAse (exonuclease V) beta subunit
MQESTSFQVYNASAGSGKTFTLVKEYLKILLFTGNNFSPYRFQNILAITFTNKAAAEMKERVLKNLKDFSEGKQVDMFLIIKEETALSSEDIQQRSKQVLNNILQNYSAFNITTIDAFTHRIIRNFSFDLGLSLNFEVEMDSNQLLAEAVDLLISKIGLDKELTQVLIDYSLEKTDDDKSWDISNDLRDFAKVLLNENDVNQLKKLDKNSIQDFIDLKKRLKRKNIDIESQFKSVGEKALNILEENNLNDGVYRGSYFPNHFMNLHIDFSKAKFFDQSKLKFNIENGKIYNKSADSIKGLLSSIEPFLEDLYRKSERLYEEYTRNNLVLKSLIPLAVLKHINVSLNEIKEQNNIRLNAEFNQIISDQIKGEPAPFIYERIGEKFQYYFIDEMQDTSELQWKNLIPLIENALVSETTDGDKGSLMLVGDAKQAIYRWRGGKAEQFIELTAENNPFTVSKKSKNLDTNYRSYSQVIDFNNQFFTHVSDFFDNEKYKELYAIGNHQKKTNKEGGFVQISFVKKEKEDEEKELVFAKKTLEIIQKLDSNFELGEICILVRKKKEGIAVANYLSEQKIDIISSETLLLKNNETVDFIINLISFLNINEDKEALSNALYFLSNKIDNQKDKHGFIHELIHKTNGEIFETLNRCNFDFNENEFSSLPFYDSIEYVLRSFNLVDDSSAYIFSFLDTVFEYQQRRGSGLNDFLEYWEQKKEGLCISIPEGKNAVRIMTIHKSKGLEFPVVIYPYDLDIYREIKPKVWYENLKEYAFLNIETSLIEYSKKLSYTGVFGQNLYSSRREEIQLDSMNLLYVALTRSAEQLYIITEKKSKDSTLDEAKYFSDFFISFLKNRSDENSWADTKMTYDFGGSKRVQSSKEIVSDKNTLELQNFISSHWKNHNISIVANSSKLWDTDQERSIIYGNLIHEILSKIVSKDDVESVLQQYVFEGILSNKESKEILKKINAVVYHARLEKYFDKNLRILNEQALISNEKEIQIPDRIVFYKDRVVIIDFKTGAPMKKHHHQLNKYERVMKELGYSAKEKLLVYIDSKVLVDEVS